MFRRRKRTHLEIVERVVSRLSASEWLIVRHWVEGSENEPLVVTRYLASLYEALKECECETCNPTEEDLEQLRQLKDTLVRRRNDLEALGIGHDYDRVERLKTEIDKMLEELT